MRLSAIAAAILTLAATLTTTPAHPHPGRTDAGECHRHRRGAARHCHTLKSHTLKKASSEDNRRLVWVRQIVDGDTVEVEQNGTGETIRVRMICVDAPELSQLRWGKASADRLASLLPVGSAAQLRFVDEDRFGLTVAEIYREGQSVNLQMVKDGQAVVYRQYLHHCAATREQYLQAEAEAKQARRGYWGQPNPISPQDHRIRERSR